VHCNVGSLSAHLECWADVHIPEAPQRLQAAGVQLDEVHRGDDLHEDMSIAHAPCKAGVILSKLLAAAQHRRRRRRRRRRCRAKMLPSRRLMLTF